MAANQKLPRIPGAASVYQDSRGFYTAVFNIIKPDGEPGRRPLRSKTPTGLKIKARDFVAKWEASGMAPGASTNVEQWMTYWLEEVAAENVRPKTLANYRSLTRRHIIPRLGKTPLDNLTAALIRGFNKKVRADTSSTTALTVYRILSSALSAAEKEGKVARNTARLVKAPKRDVPKIEPLTVDEAGALIRTFAQGGEQSAQAVLWATYLLTGARRGEILGLQWDRVTDVLDLEWQLQRHPVGMNAPVDYQHRHLGGGLYLTRPKSDSSIRVFPLVEPLRSILETWRLRAPENPHGLVFATPAGEPIDPDEVTRAWHKALQVAGIKRRVRLHDARHTAIDLMVEAGVDEDVIREIVGHSTLMMTRAYRSKSTRKRLTAGLEPFTKMLTQPEDVG